MDQTQENNGPSFDAASQGGELNFEELFRSTQQELQQTKESLGRQIHEVKSGAKQSSEELDRIRRAISGREEEPVDQYQAQIQALELEMDQYLEAAIEAERKGSPIPLTVNSAISNLKHQIRYVKDQQAWAAEREEMKAKIKELSNPSARIDEAAYNNMDSLIQSSLQQIFGNDQETIDVQFDAVSKHLIREIKDLRKNDPETWDRIRRDRNAQVKMVNHFVQKNIPPRARQLVEEDRIKRTPLSEGELLSAFREAKELYKKDPSTQNKNLLSEIRGTLLAQRFDKSMGKGNRNNRINDMIDTYS